MNDFNSIFKDVKDSFSSLGVGATKPSSPQNQPDAANPPVQAAAPLSFTEARVRRYRDSYRIAKTLNVFGTLAKVVGLVGGGILAFISFTAGMGLMQKASNAPFGAGDGLGVLGGFVLVCGVGLGVLIAAVFFALGVVISALRQNLFAALDTAVHTSPFLTDEQKAEASS